MTNKIDTKIYSYSVFDISDKNETGFKAIVPKFPHLHIFADTPMELHKVVQIAIKEEIENLEKAGIPIPKPDKKTYSGRFVLRLKPEIHEQLAHISKASGKTLNQYLSNIIEKAIT